jgi:tRNA dimethylallyltransferase
MKKLLVIVGATGTGKTGLGIELAKKFPAKGGGEIVSADSRQVYKYLDIGTGKDISKNSKLKTQNSKLQLKSQKFTVGFYSVYGIRVWLYDVIEPDQRFSAVEYAKLAWRVINDIWKRGKLPILVGGTGFYIKAVLEGIGTSGVVADWELRGKLEKLNKDELQKQLKVLNIKRWETMNESDRQNPRRLVRAIEIALQSQKSKVKSQKCKLKVKTSDALIIGLTADRTILYKRIDKRVEKRVRQGIVEEIKMLIERGYSWEDPGFNTLGYKEWENYFKGEADIEEIIQKWKYGEHSYARRQLTWFKKQKNIRWFNLSLKDYRKRVEESVKKWYHKNKHG